MKLRSTRSSTLLEVVVSMILLSILAITFTILSLFSLTHVLAVDRRSKVQNDLSYILEHSAKQVSMAIGNAKINRTVSDGDQIVRNEKIDVDDGAAIEFYVDDAVSPSDPGDGVYGTGGDHWEAYRFRPKGTADEYQLLYCEHCSGFACASCDTGWEVLGRKVTSVTYTPYDGSVDYVDMSIEGCWDPAKITTSDECGSSDRNPRVSMKARFKMPSVSVK